MRFAQKFLESETKSNKDMCATRFACFYHASDVSPQANTKERERESVKSEK